MWGGQVSLDQFRMAKRTEIAASVGQKILFSRRGALRICCLSRSPQTAPLHEAPHRRKATTAILFQRKHMPKSDIITNLSNIRVEGPARPNSKECVEALDILALCWRPS